MTFGSLYVYHQRIPSDAALRDLATRNDLSVYVNRDESFVEMMTLLLLGRLSCRLFITPRCAEGGAG